MNKCIKCGSYAFNLHKDNIDQGSLCDVHYWQGRAHRAEAQPEQEFVTLYKNIPTFYVRDVNGVYIEDNPLNYYTTPPQRTWVGLMRGVRVEGDTVVISTKDNTVARDLCGALIGEKNT
jgi:hypothetical protein